ncbi:phage virion morphogenesis protein [Helicobacter muridarum]|uniref:Mu-like prophage protein gpG n=1 Tax=Helicobacter muridarum TaxID=216 RepID=A0A099U281_9HELI|nr:phage virion morphogenesis protein [Helicobacter muridarum]TLE00953.1 phage virion morphogenesis protein [Helicobacter muridarum]STQ86737.1 Mu-like prophage protein gpG [Helicobacter muridarum]
MKISLNQLIKDIDYTIKQVDNLGPMLHEISNAAYNESQLSFEQEKSPFNEKWKPLSQKTLKSKKSSKILRESGTLKSSINARVKDIKQNKDSVQGSVSIGTNLEYAPIHQLGGQAGKGLKINIPARPFLPVNEKAEIPKALEQDIREIVLRHLNIK